MFDDKDDPALLLIPDVVCLILSFHRVDMVGSSGTCKFGTSCQAHYWSMHLLREEHQDESFGFD